MRVRLEANAPLPAWRHRVTQEGATAWTRMLDDPNPIHHDAELVARLGLGERPINPGPANIAYFYNMLGACFPAASTPSLRVRLKGAVHVGELVEVRGSIVAVDERDERVVVRCALELHADASPSPAAVATAHVVLPPGYGSGE